MTAQPEHDQRAAQAQAAGETAAAVHQAAAQQQHQTAGSAMVAEQPSTPDDVAVSWIPSGDDAARPTLVPSEPRPVNSGERNPADPT